MLKSNKAFNIFFWLYIITTITIQSRFLILSPPQILITTFQLLLLCTLIYIMRNNWKNKHWKALDLYLIWVIISTVRGYIIQENYWEAKNLLNNFLSLSVPLVYFVFAYNPIALKRFLQQWKKYIIPISLLIFIASSYSTIWGRIFSPISIFLLLSIYFSRKKRLFLICISIIIILSDIAARSLFIKYGVPIFIILFMVHKLHLHLIMTKLTHAICFALPLILLMLGISGKFNIFKLQDYMSTKLSYTSSYGTEESVLDDTRTLIYEEQIISALNNKYLIYGRTPARGYDSKWGESSLDELYNSQNAKGDKGKKLKAERYRCEVGILNIFNWMGMVGVILYSLLFFQASWLAIYKSNNTFIKITGIYIATRWTFSWIEDNIAMDANQIILWLCITICYSYSFRRMTNQQIYQWAYSIFKDNGKINRKLHVAQ